MYTLKIGDSFLITDGSESDFKQMLSEKLGEDAVKWFNSIIEDYTEEPESENWEAIADDLRSAMCDVLDLVQDVTLTKNKKLDRIELLANQYI